MNIELFLKGIRHLIYNRLLEFLKKHNVFLKTQYGFQKKYRLTMPFSISQQLLLITLTKIFILH